RVLPEPVKPAFRSVDLTGSADPAPDLERLRQDKSHQRMEVEAGEVIDITLTQLPGGNHRLHVDVDMLAGDAQSYRRILDDLAELYDTDAELDNPIGYTFREYLAAKEAAATDNSAAEAWWAERLEQLPDIPALPVLAEAERTDPARSIRLHHWFAPEAKAQLNKLAHGHGVTPAVTLATVFSEVVARWSAQQRFLLNVPLFDREPLHDDIDRVVGDFTNSVLVDIDATRTESALDRAKRLQRELHTCAVHSTYEGLDVLRDLGRVRGAPVTPSVVFTSGLDLGELFSDSVTRLFGEPVWIISQGPQVDLDAQAVDLAGGLLVNWDARRDAMPEGVIEQMFAEFCRLLQGLVDSDADWNSPLTIALPESQRKVRERVNATATELGHRTLHGAFFQQADDNPERPALLARDGVSIGYGDLSRQSLSVARALTEAGVRPGDSVAVVVAKGYRQIPAVLGVLAAGATYVPIGIGQPAARRDRILAGSGATVALVDVDAELPAGVTAIALESALTGPGLDRPHVPGPDSTAYVLFTSGSTGEPKGVEVSHRAATNTIDALAVRFGMGPQDRLLGLSALEFDLSVYDIFAPLAVGGALVCVDGEIERDAQAWTDLIAAYGVTVLNCAPGLIGMLLDTADAAALGSLRLVVTGGDRVGAELGHRLRDLVPGLRFAGLGGATEAAIHSTVCEVDDDFPVAWTSVPYGTPLANVRMRVVNERGEDCPDWVIGELWLGGTSIADGYRGDPERTAQRFVEYDGVRWYRTGDLARYLPDGTVDFLGRADHQVKIRGYRVELGEVEAALTTLDSVGQAVAVVTGGGRLVAAVSRTGDTSDLRAALADLLPPHMIPEHIEILQTVPLTGNGKLDRAAITRLLDAGTPVVQAYVPPANAVEAALAYIAEQILGIESVGVESDFFDIGGNSILATTFTAQVRGLLAVEKFGVTDIFTARTVRGIGAELIGRDSGQLDRVARILLELAGIEVPDPALAGPG
ncbi:MAG: amino acid adenylation domain-containing protein, partial [Nocardia sp.]|nr:amino acid adenylation domain-containing protein [Nocardia sp.]